MKIKILIKRLIMVVMLIGFSLFLGFLIMLYIYFSQSKEVVEIAKRGFTPGTKEYEIYKKWDERSDRYYSFIHNAKNYLVQNNYNGAIKEYNKALNMEYNKWLTHMYLLEVYEKAGHYNLAIEEIDWLLAQNPRQQVVEELKNRKTQIKSYIKEGSKIVNVINGITEKDYVLKEMGKPDEILELDDGQTKWVYKNYITLETVIPNFAKSQDFIITFDKNDIVLDNYIGIHRTESEINELTPPELKN